MKRILSIAAAVLAMALALSGCGKGETYTSDKTVAQIAGDVMGSVEFAMGMEASEEELSEYYGITKENYTEIYAYNGMMISADTLYIAKAADGKADALKAEFESRLAAVQQSFEQYLPDAYEMAKNGEVVVRGDYVMLVISADNEKAIAAFENDIVKK
mgnify:CR=1 FL=1